MHARPDFFFKILFQHARIGHTKLHPAKHSSNFLKCGLSGFCGHNLTHRSKSGSMLQENLLYAVDYFHELTSLEIEQSENQSVLHPLSASYGNQLAVAHSCFLTLVPSGENAGIESVYAEIEFDHSIEALCWAGDSEGFPECEEALLIVAGDSEGFLHFVTPSGVLVYSHRITQGKCRILQACQRSKSIKSSRLLEQVNQVNTPFTAFSFCLDTKRPQMCYWQSLILAK